MLPDDELLEIKQFLESKPDGVPLRELHKKFPELHYYQIYNLLTNLGYSISEKTVLIEKKVRYIIKGVDNNGRMGQKGARTTKATNNINY